MFAQSSVLNLCLSSFFSALDSHRLERTRQFHFRSQSAARRLQSPILGLDEFVEFLMRANGAQPVAVLKKISESGEPLAGIEILRRQFQFRHQLHHDFFCKLGIVLRTNRISHAAFPNAYCCFRKLARNFPKISSATCIAPTLRADTRRGSVDR